MQQESCFTIYCCLFRRTGAIIQPIKPYIFWKLMTHAIHRFQIWQWQRKIHAQRHAQRHIQRRRRKRFQCSSVNEYRLQCPLAHVLSPLVEKDKDKVFKRPKICFFLKALDQGYQIWQYECEPDQTGPDRTSGHTILAVSTSLLRTFSEILF